MIQHPAEGTLQAYLDGEVLSESREALDRHMDGCHECQEALAQLDSMADATGAALAVVDRPAPATDAARWDVRRTRAARRSRTHRRRVSVAASVVLLVGAGWAAAMPGSPIRGWWTGRSSEELPVTIDQQVTGLADAQRIGVRVEPVEGQVSVSFDGVPGESWVEIRIADIAETGVRVPVGSRFESGAGRIHVEIDGLEGDLLVEIPSTATLADVLVDGRPVFRKSGSEVSYPGPAPVVTGGGSVRFQAGGGP